MTFEFYKKIFGGDDMASLEYLEEERKKIWEKILHIEEELQKKTSDYEKDAKQASRKASEFRNRCEDAKSSAYENLNLIKSTNGNVSEILDSVRSANSEISEIKAKSSEQLVLVSSSYEEIKSLEKVIKSKIDAFEEILTNHPALADEITTLENTFTDAEDIGSKINTLYKSSLSRKKEIDQLYYDIEGYVDKNDEGEETKVEGLRGKLETSFDEVKGNIKKYSNELVSFKEEKEEDVVRFIERWTHEIEIINEKIKELCQTALKIAPPTASNIDPPHL